MLLQLPFPIWVKSCAKLRKIWKRKSSGSKVLLKIYENFLLKHLKRNFRPFAQAGAGKQPKMLLPLLPADGQPSFLQRPARLLTCCRGRVSRAIARRFYLL
jgi:hypothetical protein